MSVQVVHHGGAIEVDGQLHRLKDLLGCDQLGDGSLRIHAATVTSKTAHLVLNDGSHHRAAVGGEDPHGPADLLIRNAGQILTMGGEDPADPDDPIGLVADGAVACRGSSILGVCHDDEVEQRFGLCPGARVLDARGGLVTPGLVDPHTHPVFAGQRCVEFGLKAAGKSYLEIHKAGGGILSTVEATRAAEFDDLAAVCARNLSSLLSWGVTTVEGKSGYALETAGELRMLEVLRVASECHAVDAVATLLGAHTLPPATDREAYVGLVREEMIPAAASAGLAEYCDAYCEDGAFTPDEVERIFTTAKEHGLGLRLHAEQFTDQGGAGLAARLGAVSADHLEAISPAGIEAMARAGTIAVLLPGAALTCRCPYPPARDLLDAGVEVGLGTDLNPGSSMTGSLPLMMSLACMQMGLTCEEAWRAVTVVAARSVGRDNIGRISSGSRADLVLFDAPDYRYIPYHYGENHVQTVVKNGRVVLTR